MRLIKNLVLNLSYSKTVKKRKGGGGVCGGATLIIMHDTTLIDHMTVSMWRFMNSGTKNGS
jgi:hypothetical protein